MLALWAVLLPILLVDVLNPVLFAFMIPAAGTKRPIVTSLALLAGHSTAYLVAGFALALGLDSIAERLENPQSIDFMISLVIGVVLVVLAVWPAGESERQEKRKRADMSPSMAFGTGAVVNFIGIPFAVPYFAALGQVLASGLSSGGQIGTLVAYNALYALPFLIVPVAIAISGDGSRVLLQRINAVLIGISAALMPFLLGGIGLFLIADAIAYFSTGSGLI